MKDAFRPAQLRFDGPITPNDRDSIRTECALGVVFNWSSLAFRWGVTEAIAKGMWEKWKPQFPARSFQ